MCSCSIPAFSQRAVLVSQAPWAQLFQLGAEEMQIRALLQASPLLICGVGVLIYISVRNAGLRRETGSSSTPHRQAKCAPRDSSTRAQPYVPECRGLKPSGTAQAALSGGAQRGYAEPRRLRKAGATWTGNKE